MTQYSAFQVTTGNNTAGPGASIAFGAGIVMGLGFEVTSTGQFLYGYYAWRSDSSQSASASFALWTVTSATTGTEQGASARASISGMATGQWNYIALATPFALTQNQTYKIVVGITGNFNDTHNQFGNAGAPYLGGIVNGPLNVYSGPVAFSGTNQMGFANTYQGSFLTGGGGGSGAADPTANYPNGDDSSFNPWIDLLVGPASSSPVWLSQGTRRPAARTPALPPVRRYRQTLPVPAQLNPPFTRTEIAQHRQEWPRGLPRRGHVTFVVPPQLNPPYPFAEIRQQRQPRGLFPRRGHGFTPVPAQQSAAANPAITFQQPHHLRMLFQRRGRVFMPVPAQQSAPANPAITFQQARHQRVLFRRQGHVFTPVPPQLNPPYPVAETVRHQAQPRGLLRRGHVFTPVPAQVNPPWVQSHRAPLRAIALIRRRFAQLIPWPQAVKPAFTPGTLTAYDVTLSALTASDAGAAALTATTTAPGGPS